MDSILLSSQEAYSRQTMYNIPSTSTYVTDKDKVSFYPSGATSFESSGGGRLCRFHLGSQNWLDPSSVSLQFRVNSKSTKLSPLQQPWGFIKRLRVLLKGNIVTDLDNFNRCNEVLTRCNGRNYYDNQVSKGIPLPKKQTFETVYSVQDSIPLLDNNASRTISLKLPGLFESQVLLPLQYIDLVIEIEFISNFSDNLHTMATSASTFNYTGSLTDIYTIDKPTIRADVCHLDSEVENKFVMSLLDGNSMNISFTNYSETEQTLTSADEQISVSRSLTKLKHLYITYQKNLAGTRASLGYYLKNWNALYAPRKTDPDNLLTAPGTQSDPIKKLQVQVGSKLFPAYPITSIAECYEQLTECFGYNVAFEQIDFYNDKFVFALNFEKLRDVNFTGINTKNSPIVINTNTESTQNKLHVLFAYDSIIEIRDTGVSIYD